jgi:hypothetical protein
MPGLLAAVPRLALPAKSSPAAGSAGLPAGAPAAAAGGAPEDAGRPLAIPRLNLTASMHSNLETRTASAELQASSLLDIITALPALALHYLSYAVHI